LQRKRPQSFLPRGPVSFSVVYGFTGAMCQSSQRLPRMVTESLRFMESMPAGVQQSMSQVHGV